LRMQATKTVQGYFDLTRVIDLRKSVPAGLIPWWQSASAKDWWNSPKQSCT
jgi:hypothetical protein